MINRFMRIVVMFDLPTDTKPARKIYSEFRRYLINAGYDMLQYSVYSRICPNRDAADEHVRRLQVNAPKKGAVRVILITNKQFAEAVIVTGQKKAQEKRVNDAQMLLF